MHFNVVHAQKSTANFPAFADYTDNTDTTMHMLATSSARLVCVTHLAQQKTECVEWIRKDGTKFKRWDLAKIDFIIGAYKLYYI